MLNNYLYEICYLEDSFFEDYPNPPNCELLKKKERPYNCLIIETHYDYCICIPYRTNIKHANGFIFRKSKRAKLNRSGLDYSKSLIIKDMAYLKKGISIIDKDEYLETKMYMDKIVIGITKYIDDYINHHKATDIIIEPEYRRKYSLSTLQYFHDLLNL